MKAAVTSPGDGKVLVVDGGGSSRRALLGDDLAMNASKKFVCPPMSTIRRLTILIAVGQASSSTVIFAIPTSSKASTSA